MKHLLGKRALVTGAASGIGRAIAIELANQGMHLYLLDIDSEGLKNVADELLAYDVEVCWQQTDLSSRSDLTRAIEQFRDEWGTLDLLVNNAGIAYYGPTQKMTADQWDKLLGVNLLAPIELTRALLPMMLERPEAHILNICSIAGLVAGGRFAAYQVSKFGLIGFSESLRAEFGRKGLGVTALCPGPVLTKLYERAMKGNPLRKVPCPPKWVCVTEETVASCGIRAVRRNRRLVLVGLLAHALYQVKRFFPGLLDALQQIHRKKSKTVQAIPDYETLPSSYPILGSVSHEGTSVKKRAA